MVLAVALGVLAGIALTRGWMWATASPAPTSLTSGPVESTVARPPRQPQDDHGVKWTNQNQLATVPPIAAPANPPKTATPTSPESPVVDFQALVVAAGPDALTAVVPYLTNSNRETRQQALATVVQFDDRSLIPRLHQIAAQTTDPVERSNILAAADYLNLPTPTEYLGLHGTNAVGTRSTTPRTVRKKPITTTSAPPPTSSPQ